ncbi:FHA domain-containing protein, partial [Microcoleus sp. MOSTC5]|uniref:FHA domain-containing protein n=1 Tax=Microcoleus sp. MOSTC5 TaxID=3055378 RepID=UPI002FD1F5FD
VLSNPTVSALHIEILFDSQQRFLVRNLRDKNPLYINGQPLSQGEAALHQGSVLRLGEAELRITSVTQRQYPVGSVPSGSFSTSQPYSPQPVAPTVQAGRSSSGSYQMNADESATNVSGGNNPPVPNSTPASPHVDGQTSKNPEIFWKWFWATLAGSILGLIAFFTVIFIIAVATTGTVNETVLNRLVQSRWSSSLAWGFYGLVVGTLQWVVLRKQMPKASNWIPATILGYVFYGSLMAASKYISFSSTASPDPLRDIGVNLCGGGIIGLAQWFHYFRKYISNSAWWILLSITTSVLGSLMSVSIVTIVLVFPISAMIESRGVDRLLKQYFRDSHS